MRHSQASFFSDDPNPPACTSSDCDGDGIPDHVSLDAALTWAARCPAAEYGAVELRPLADMTHVFGPGHRGQPRG